MGGDGKMSLVPLLGAAWMFGDNVDTDAIYPGQYMHILDKREMASYAFKFHKPAFANKVEPNDIIIGGRNFGCGSSREHAVLSLKHCGIGAIIALSFARIFYRNAINNGIPVLTFDMDPKQVVALYSNVLDGDDLDLNFTENYLEVVSSGERFKLNPLPPHLMSIINAGGLVEYTREQLKRMKQ
jgi:3-isopropylmalate/(R)-2-methylmalate dehydratase small subunit